MPEVIEFRFSSVFKHFEVPKMYLRGTARWTNEKKTTKMGANLFRKKSRKSEITLTKTESSTNCQFICLSSNIKLVLSVP